MRSLSSVLWVCLVWVSLLGACDGDVVLEDAAAPMGADASTSDAAGPGVDGGSDLVDAGDTVDAGEDVDAATTPDAGSPPEPCATRITYGSAWIRAAGRTSDHDDVADRVTWDGVCHPDASGNSYAELSNGWRPYFRGPTACVIALDVTGDCAPAAPDACTTRITYGSSWLRAPGHAADYDQVRGVVTWDGECAAAGGDSATTLSNGWVPHFGGRGSCQVSLRYEQCGGLYANPVLDTSCADPGVVADGDRYVMTCTSGNAAAAFPLRTSTDLVHWTNAGHVFPSGTRPGWGSGDFWAPEIHRVGDRWVVYYSARSGDGSLALGAATATDVLGPYTDLGRPLLHDPSPGVIDASFFEAPDGTRYLLWKIDGNAVGRRTPIYIQPLAADGVTLRGSRTEILSNTLGWEGALVEGPWMIHRSGTYYLFYSANGYATTRYAVGVARSSSPTGPFTKLGDPILTSNGSFGGPGHGSVLRGPSGDWVHVYHSWLAGSVGGAPGRLVLVDRIDWRDGWPHMSASPSPISQPLP
ncbi:MAG: family 43 glycosylhydrolase [Sandaracinaceae bacterium]|nr:family 43 glycosylhydrolase [Sandaracinaceae bacterium]